ncbi:cyclin-D4-1-like [Apium graveolens]|uniref:cyclin-D4-1-like n=1 Tax=Apium graveolens TaxID=4045 RepID=UPI003D78D569
MDLSLDYDVSSVLCDEENESIYFDDDSDECVDSMFAKGCVHLAAHDYLQRLRNRDLDLKARQEAVNLIKKARSHFSFGPICVYLSVNYLDRFLSPYESSTGKERIMQLLVVACSSLPAKVEEIEVALSLNL